MPIPKLTIPNSVAIDIERLISDLFPLSRTLMGEGFERSLNLISNVLPLERLAIPSGTACGSWKIPEDWKLKNARLEDLSGKTIIDHASDPFMVWQYSEATDTRLTLESLLERTVVGPEAVPDATPLVVTYYRRRWGLSLSTNQVNSLADREYRVCIDAEFKPGYLTIGSVEIPGRTKDVVLIDAVLSCASLANNLSGVVVAALLGGLIKAIENPKYTYRILFTPETLGPIATHFHFPSLHSNVVGGLTLGNLGYGDCFSYRRSRLGDTPVDSAVEHVLAYSGRKSQIENYDVRTGSCGNEKAYNSLGIEIPIGALRRKPLGSYPEYDTSADNLNFVSIDLIKDALSALWEIIYCLENNALYLHTFEGEPFLTGYNIFPSSEEERVYFDYLMGFSDGRHSLLEIANRSKKPIWNFESAVKLMLQQGLLRSI